MFTYKNKFNKTPWLKFYHEEQFMRPTIWAILLYVGSLALLSQSIQPRLLGKGILELGTRAYFQSIFMSYYEICIIWLN